MGLRFWAVWIILGVFVAMPVAGSEGERSKEAEVHPSAVERGKTALTQTGFLKPEWSEGAYRNAGKLWDQPAPNPEHATRPVMRPPSRTDTACTRPPTRTTACPWACVAALDPTAPGRVSRSIAWPVMAARSGARVTWAWATLSSISRPC